MTVQPALAETFQYRFPLQAKATAGLPDSSAAPGGNGEGSVDTGDNPVQPGVPQLMLNPAALWFESNPDVQPVTRSSLVTNTGSAATMVAGIVSNTNFSISHNCPESLAVDETCVISVTPKSAAPGEVSYQMPVTAPGAATQVALSMSAYERDNTTYPRLHLGQDLVFLGELNPGQQGQGSTTITNTGAATAILGGIQSGGGFAVTSDCPAELAVGASCTVTAKFSSYDAKSHSHTLGLTSVIGGIPTPLTFYATVKGNPAILPALELDKGTLAFGPLDAGASQTKQAVLTNRGTAPALLSGITATAPFSVTSGCPAELAAGSSCTLIVTFNALEQGTTPAYTMNIMAQDDVKTQLLLQGQVTGTDNAAPRLTFNPTSLSFGEVAIGQSAVNTTTVTNTGPVAASITKVTVDRAADTYGQANDCGSSLAPGASCTVTVTFTPKEADTSGGRVAVKLANGPDGSLPVSGKGLKAVLSMGPVSVNFGAVALPGTSVERTVNLSNSGNVPLTGLAVSNSDNRLNINYGTCTQVLEAKKGCSMTVQYSPDTASNFSGSFQVTSANGGTASIAWTGTAVNLTAAPSSLTFASTRVGTTAPAQQVTLTNGGTAPVPFDGISVTVGTSAFGQSNNCGTALAAGSSCTIAVAYTPTSVGTLSGEVSVVVKGTLVARIALAGTGISPQLTLSSTSLRFANTNVGQASEVLSFSVSNPVNETATISGMGISSGEAEFAQSNNCGSSLAAGASCTVNVQMTPASAEGSSGRWTVTSSFGTQSVSLQGKGTVPSGGVDGETATPPAPDAVDDGSTHYSITFLDTKVGTSSAVRDVKFTNKGDGPLTVLGVGIASGETDFAQSNNCGSTLAPGAYCTISLLFTPAALGERTGGVALNSDGGSFFFNLKGNGVGATGAWRADSSADFGFVGVNSTAQRSFTFTNTGTIAAKDLMTEVVGADLRLVSNTCGTADAPVTVDIGGSCKTTVEYAPTTTGELDGARLQTTGGLANGPATLALSGSAPPPAVAFDASPTGAYGEITSGTDTSRTFVLRNAGQLADTMVAAPSVSGTGFTVTGGSCQSGTRLAAKGGACTVIVTASSPTTGTLTGTLRATSEQGASANLALSATVIQSTYVLSGTAGSTTATAPDFGRRTAGASSTTRTFYLRDEASVATVATSRITLVGDSSFTVTRIMAVSSSGASQTAACAYNDSGSTAPCSTTGTGQPIRVDVKFAPTTIGAKAAALRFEHNGAGGVVELPLTGSAEFNPTAAWSSVPGSVTSPTAEFLAYGTLTTGATASKNFYLKNTGTNGGQAVGFTLSGDTSQFKVTLFMKSSTGGYVSTCVTGGTIGSVSATPCQADDIVSGSYPSIRVKVDYMPTEVGSHSFTLTPTTNNGTVLPSPITFTGSGQFNPTAAWSRAPDSTVPPTAAALDFGPRTRGTTTSGVTNKVLYVRNIGTNGSQAVGFTLSGDTSQFDVYSIHAATSTGYGSACASGGSISTSAVTPCLANDVALGPYPHIRIAVRYAPKTTGNHSITLMPTTNNGTVLTDAQPITVTGSGVFNPTASWSSSTSSVVALTAANLSYGSKAAGTTTDKNFYLRNTGTNGAQAVGFTLTGDISQFKIILVRKQGTSSSSFCNPGGVVNGSGSSATDCLADDVASGPYSSVLVQVRYVPMAAGSHSITVTPTTNNGTVLPDAISLTGNSP